MSEVKSRPAAPRGRGSGQRGRGGFSNRGGRGGTRQTNGTKPDLTGEEPNNDDEGEIGQWKKLYASKLTTVKEMFPDWTNEDIVFALQETDGDLEATIERITEGNVAQWGEVKKKTKDRTQSRPKDPALASTEAASNSVRGSRGRGGLEGVRGGRGRGSDRGRGATRGARGGLMNGPRGNNPVKIDGTTSIESATGEIAGTDTAASSGDMTVADSTPLDSSWENITTDAAGTPSVEELKVSPKPSSKPDGTRSWASMFSKPAPAPAAPKTSIIAPSHENAVESFPATVAASTEPEMPGLPPPVESVEIPNTPPASDLAISEVPTNITPSKDELTETNLEQVPDISAPAPAATAASTVASTVDLQGAAAGAPPQQQVNSRPPLGGYATSAYKATGMPGVPGRSVSYQRKVMEQREAVVMPEKHAVDRAAVQFGSMGLNGTTEDADVDSDREDAETRAQPPQHSPIAPRAALPPAPLQQAFSSQPQVDSLPTPRQAPGLPPLSQPPGMQLSPPGLTGEQATPIQPLQHNNPYNQLNSRYGSQPTHQEISPPVQKAYEPFGQQMQQSQQYDGYHNVSQAQTQPQNQVQSHLSGYSSAANDTGSYYTSDNQRNAYQNNYYGSFSQQPQPNTQENGPSQQRGGSAFGTSAADQNPQYATSQASQQPSNRFNQSSEAANSGHSTPNPSLSSQQQPGQPHPMLQQGQGQAGSQHGGYAYGQPYYASPYYNSYMSHQVSSHPYGRERPMFDDVRRYDDQYLTQNTQFGYGSSQGGYGGPFGGAGAKQGMYGQPHQGYGMSPQTPYDQHSASPANAGAFGQNQASSGRDSSVAGLGSYGRTGSTQPSEPYNSAGANSHGNIPDVFGRSQTNYSGQGSGISGHMAQQGGNEDSLRSYGDSSKVPGGPSPALGQPSGRPGSAANPQNPGGIAPPQGQSQNQQGYGGYLGHQMHGQQGSQYGSGPGGLGSHHQYGGQNHQAGGYGAYGAGYGTSSYGNSNRGGWGASYGH